MLACSPAVPYILRRAISVTQAAVVVEVDLTLQYGNDNVARA
jgi:hypothetical protein